MSRWWRSAVRMNEPPVNWSEGTVAAYRRRVSRRHCWARSTSTSTRSAACSRARAAWFSAAVWAGWRSRAVTTAIATIRPRRTRRPSTIRLYRRRDRGYGVPVAATLVADDWTLDPLEPAGAAELYRRVDAAEP